MSSKPTVHVAAAIIHDGKGHILAACRADGDLAGKWELPGGKVAPGETSEACCRREVAEELGCTLGTMVEYDTVHHDYPDFHLDMDVFVATPVPGQTPRAIAHAEIRWLSRDELMDVDWLDADRPLVLGVGVMWGQLFEAEML